MSSESGSSTYSSPETTPKATPSSPEPAINATPITTPRAMPSCPETANATDTIPVTTPKAMPSSPETAETTNTIDAIPVTTPKALPSSPESTDDAAPKANPSSPESTIIIQVATIQNTTTPSPKATPSSAESTKSVTVDAPRKTTPTIDTTTIHNIPSPMPSPTRASPESQSKSRTMIEALAPIITAIPPSLSSSPNIAHTLLHDPQISSQISTLLRRPDSGAGDNQLCRWLYDTFQSSDPGLQLVVLRFIPLIAGIYLCRANKRKPQAGFEAVLLAVYAYETTSRGGQAVTVTLPDLSNASIYHESNSPVKNSATELNRVVISPSLEPHGTVRSTRRAWIVGVALELYYSKIASMPISSKMEFCEFCEIWAGQEVSMNKEECAGPSDSNGSAQAAKQGRIPLPWELLQPSLRILGHCLMGPLRNAELYKRGCSASKCLYARALHDINPRAILATGSLIKLVNMESDANYNVDHTEIPDTRIISV